MALNIGLKYFLRPHLFARSFSLSSNKIEKSEDFSHILQESRQLLEKEVLSIASVETKLILDIFDENLENLEKNCSLNIFGAAFGHLELLSRYVLLDKSVKNISNKRKLRGKELETADDLTSLVLKAVDCIRLISQSISLQRGLSNFSPTMPGKLDYVIFRIFWSFASKRNIDWLCYCVKKFNLLWLFRDIGMGNLYCQDNCKYFYD